MPDPTQPRLFAGLTLEELEATASAIYDRPSSVPEDCERIAEAILKMITAYRDLALENATLRARLELVRAGKVM